MTDEVINMFGHVWWLGVISTPDLFLYSYHVYFICGENQKTCCGMK